MQRTALHEAVFAGNLHMARRLIELGADLEAIDDFGRTPRDELANEAPEDLLALLGTKTRGSDATG